MSISQSVYFEVVNWGTISILFTFNLLSSHRHKQYIKLKTDSMNFFTQLDKHKDTDFPSTFFEMEN